MSPSKTIREIIESAWAWRWKDRIDRRFVERYRFGPAESRER